MANLRELELINLFEKYKFMELLNLIVSLKIYKTFNNDIKIGGYIMKNWYIKFIFIFIGINNFFIIKLF